MRKLLVFIALAASLIIPSAAGAQGETIINELRVRLWPEYDQNALLVIYNFTLAPGTTTPAAVQFRLPKDARVTAVARETANGLFAVDFTPLKETDGQLISFDVTDQVGYQLEYYVPILKNGADRHFSFTWPGDYVVNTLVVDAQEPSQSTGFKSDPVLPNAGSSPDSLPTHSGTFGSLKKGEQWQLQADYSRTTDDLTVSGQPVQPSGGAIDNNASGSSALLDFLSNNVLIILGIFGVLLIVAGLVWYWQSGSSSRTMKGRKRHTAHSEINTSEGQVYCPQCGKRAQPADKFCRACGIRLRREEA